MKNIPLPSEAQIARTAGVTAGVGHLTMVNDAIVGAIEAGSIHPGDIVYRCNKNFSAQLQSLLQERFTAAGWRLHISVLDDVTPGTTVYIYGGDAPHAQGARRTTVRLAPMRLLG